MRHFRKVFTVLLVVAMLFATSVNAFAATASVGNANSVKSVNTTYTNGYIYPSSNGVTCKITRSNMRNVTYTGVSTGSVGMAVFRLVNRSTGDTYTMSLTVDGGTYTYERAPLPIGTYDVTLYAFTGTGTPRVTVNFNL